MKKTVFNAVGGGTAYEAPNLVLLEIATERGFALSTEGSNEGWGEEDEAVDW